MLPGDPPAVFSYCSPSFYFPIFLLKFICNMNFKVSVATKCVNTHSFISYNSQWSWIGQGVQIITHLSLFHRGKVWSIFSLVTNLFWHEHRGCPNHRFYSYKLILLCYTQKKPFWWVNKFVYYTSTSPTVAEINPCNDWQAVILTRSNTDRPANWTLIIGQFLLIIIFLQITVDKRVS